MAAVTAAILLISAVGPVLALSIKGRIAGAVLLAAASAALAVAAVRWCGGIVPIAARFRRMLMTLAAGQAAVLAVGIATLGLSYINLDSLHDERLYFHLLVTVPLGLGLLELTLGLLPPILRANLIVFLVLWIATEMIFGRLLPRRVEGEPIPLMQPEYWRDDASVGYGLVPNNRAEQVKRLGNRQLMSATYVIDSFGRRLTIPYAADSRTNFLLFFGDSNTFGEGVNQSQTIPYQVALLAPRYHPYNYALSGYGPAQALDLIKSRDLRKEVAEPQGFAMFVFLPALLDRVRGGSPVSAGWGRHFSEYAIDASGRLVRRGDFVHSHPFRTLVYYLVNCPNVVSYFELNFPRELSDSDFALTARILTESRRQLDRQLNVRGFFVVLAPVSKGEILISRRLIPYLRAQGLAYLDLTDMFDASEPGYRLRDYHLSPLSDRLIARRLVHNLKIGASPTPDSLDPSRPIAPMQVAVTVDDCPFPFDSPHQTLDRLLANERSIAESLRRNGVSQPYGFVIGSETVTSPGSVAVLKNWLEQGYPLGNHTYSHQGLSETSAADYIADIERNDRLLQSLDVTSTLIQMRRMFRYPYLEEGDTLEKREAVRDFLRRNGYRIAEVTIDYTDWAWNEAYLRCAAQNNSNAIQWLKLHVIESVRQNLRFSQELAQSVFGRDIKHILLLHLSALNAVSLDDVLKALRADGVQFVNLDDALSDPVYQIDPRIAEIWGRTFLVRMAEAHRVNYPHGELLYTNRILDEVCRSGG